MGDAEARENSYRLMLVIDLLENRLNVLADTGELAAEELENLKKGE